MVFSKRAMLNELLVPVVLLSCTCIVTLVLGELAFIPMVFALFPVVKLILVLVPNVYILKGMLLYDPIPLHVPSQKVFISLPPPLEK